MTKLGGRVLLHVFLAIIQPVAMDFRQLISTRTPSLSARLLRWSLLPVSWAYGLGARAKNALYDLGLKKGFSSPLNVISVGNLSVGGTGKSPVVSWLASFLRQRNIRVAILSRGYGQLADGQNDEALELELLHADVPHLQHWDRIASAKLAEEELDMQCLVLDDGFQHRRLGRDLDIVLLDSSCSPHTQRLLPCGLFREPLSSLARCQVVMLTRVDQAQPQDLATLRNQVRRIAPHAIQVEASHRPQSLVLYPEEILPVENLKGKRVVAFCGIGNGESFFNALETQECEIVERRKWPDHHAYELPDVEQLQHLADTLQPDFLVCTVKDWVKLRVRRIGQVQLVALRIELQIHAGEEELKQKLEALTKES